MDKQYLARHGKRCCHDRKCALSASAIQEDMTARSAVSSLPIVRCPKNSRSGPKPYFVFGIPLAPHRVGEKFRFGCHRHPLSSPSSHGLAQDSPFPAGSVDPAGVFPRKSLRSCCGTLTKTPGRAVGAENRSPPLSRHVEEACPACLPSTRKPCPAARSACTVHSSNSGSNGFTGLPLTCLSSNSTNFRPAQLSGNGSLEEIHSIISSCKVSRISPRPASVSAGASSG